MSDPRAAAHRAAFDRSFAEPLAERPEGLVRLLALDAGAVPLAVPIRDVAAVERMPSITPLPGALPGLRGLAAARGRMVPVYTLATLLGDRSDTGDDAWLLLHESAGHVLGLSFTRFDGWVERAPADILASEDPNPVLPSLVRHDGRLRCVLNLLALLERCRVAAGVPG